MQKRYKEQKVEGRRQLQRMVTTTKTTGRHRKQCGNGEKRKGKCKTLAGRDWEGLALGLGSGLAGSVSYVHGKCCKYVLKYAFIHTNMANGSGNRNSSSSRRNNKTSQ